jgi:REP element-mobilizing transposase RayT
VHVTLRVVADVGRLRRRDGYRAVRRAMSAVLPQFESFRICHLSIQATHIHMIVEASDEKALSSGMRSFQISAARRLNAAITRRTGVERHGRVFADRYHAEPLTSPTQVRNALAYVLNNWRRHGEDRGSHAALDPFATGRTFDGFADHQRPTRWRHDDEPLPISFPKTWLLRVGWRQHGMLSTRQVPGPRDGRRAPTHAR